MGWRKIKRYLLDEFKPTRRRMNIFFSIIAIVFVIMLGKVDCAADCSSTFNKALEVSSLIASPGITTFYNDNLYFIHYGDSKYDKERIILKKPIKILVNNAQIFHFAFDIIYWYLLTIMIERAYFRMKKEEL